MRNGGGGGMGMRGNGHQGGMGMKRRWDSSGGGGQGSSDQGYPKRPYQPPSSHFSSHASNGISAGGSYQPKQPYRPNSYEQKPPSMSNMPPQTAYQAPSYPKFPGYAQMQMPPSLGAYATPIQAAIANYTFPPPQSSIMPPLPKN